jgi:hypothetical protein
MQRLYRAANLPEAYLLRELLARAGIETVVFNEHAQGGLGEIPFTQAYPELWLTDERDAARARGVIEAYESPGRSGASDSICPACGEDNPRGFELCWRCGALLPG